MIFPILMQYNPFMATKKNEKMPYQEYQILKEKESKVWFKFKPYPWPILVALLIPLGFFIMLISYYFLVVRHFSE